MKILKPRYLWYRIKYYIASFRPAPKRIDDKKVIISLASWHQRYRYLPKVLDALLKQTFKVDHILLWLDEEDEGNIPKEVIAYKNRGIDLRFTKNIGSYKKLIPALKEFPNDIIITVDDDVMYPADFVSNLYRSYCKYPDKVHANRCRNLKDKTDNWLTYQKTKVIKNKKEAFSKDFLFTGIGGVLYPTINIFHQDILKEELFLNLAPKQDDLWFWYMVYLKGRDICKIKNNFSPNKYHIVAQTEETGLWNTHNNKDEDNSPNDIALGNIRKHYNL